MLLSGLRVVEFGQLIAAPLCGLQLLDLGADVLKVEPPGGESARTMPPFDDDGESLWFHALNRGKRGTVLDRRDADGALALIAGADVVIENQAGAMPVGWEDVARDDLLWVAITGRGAGAGGRAVDPSLQAAIGLQWLTGEADGPPLRIPVNAIDIVTGMAATQTVLSKRLAGEGGFVDLALLDAAATLASLPAVAALAGEPYGRLGSQSPVAVPSGVFDTADGHVQLIAFTDRQYRALVSALGLPDDPRAGTTRSRLEHRELIHGWIAAAVATRTVQDVVDAVVLAGGLAERVNSITDGWADPLLRTRGLLGELHGHPMPTISLTHHGPTSFRRGPSLP